MYRENNRYNHKDMQEEINQLQMKKKELIEAIDAGVRTDKSISKMMRKLDSARGWGIWDIWGGKLLSNLAKHSAINKANELSYEVKENLRIFQKELNDINEFTDLRLNLSGFTTFADFFFDGLFVDFFVQSKIKNALRNTKQVQRKVNEVIRDLERDLRDVNRQLSRL